MRKNYFEAQMRDHEKRDCGYYSKCSTICAILDDPFCPCKDCNGKPPWKIEWMNREIEGFYERSDQRIRSPIFREVPGLVSVPGAEEIRYRSIEDQTRFWRNWLKDKDSSRIYIEAPRYFNRDKFYGAE